MLGLSFSATELKEGLQALIRINTSNPTGNEALVSDFFKPILEAEGIMYQEIFVADKRSSLVAKIPAEVQQVDLSDTARLLKDPIILCGHMDVVPVREEELKHWKFDPWLGEEHQGRIYGRGACDMKSGLWAAFYAFVRAKQAKLSYDLYFVATCDEEDTMLGIHSLIDQKLLPKSAQVLICEPTNLELCSASRGRCWWEVTIGGEASHGSRRSMGLNAIYPAVDLIKMLETEDFSAGADSFSGETFWQVLEIKAGLAPCVVPNLCTMTVDTRIALNDCCDEILHRFERHLIELRRLYPTAGINYRVVDKREPWQAANDEPLLQILRQKYQLKEFCFTGSTDGNPLRSAGLKVLIIGPGDLAYAHHKDEFVEIGQLYAAEKLYYDLLLEYNRFY